MAASEEHKDIHQTYQALSYKQLHERQTKLQWSPPAFPCFLAEQGAGWREECYGDLKGMAYHYLPAGITSPSTDRVKNPHLRSQLPPTANTKSQTVAADCCAGTNLPSKRAQGLETRFLPYHQLRGSQVCHGPLRTPEARVRTTEKPPGQGTRAYLGGCPMGPTG